MTSPTVLDGVATAKKIREELAAKINTAAAQGMRKPGLAVLLIGDDPASHIYVKNKVSACQKVGIESYLHQFPAETKIDEVLAILQKLNASELIDGILVQLPLPPHLASDLILSAVLPDKDVDGLHPYNMGKLLTGKPGLRPCTPQGIMALLENYQISISGKSAVVIGRSNLVGKPIALMLLEKHATVTICHSRSLELQNIAKSADILVVAAGKETMVGASWVKPGVVVIDVGIHRRKQASGATEIVGDVDYPEVAQLASYITPVPGGVGPMTVAMLLSNTWLAFQNRLGLSANCTSKISSYSK